MRALLFIFIFYSNSILPQEKALKLKEESKEDFKKISGEDKSVNLGDTGKFNDAQDLQGDYHELIKKYKQAQERKKPGTSQDPGMRNFDRLGPDSFDGIFKQLREEMERDFGDFDRLLQERSGIGHAESSVSQKDLGDSIELTINITGIESGSTSVDVENGVIYVRGEQEITNSQNHGDQTFKSISRSSFQRMIPLPEGVKESGFKKRIEKDRIILEFKKK
ncbi:MAG: Hsp20/alpha crystallin family protein [Halobacteriovoraceae bacterium]|nr:Hsp20/alpha crystallin family protein [Halobacteriovoraceae bacterium]